MEVKKRKRRHQIREQLIAERLDNVRAQLIEQRLNMGAAQGNTAREEAGKCSAEKYKKK